MVPIRENISLKPFNTFGIDATARWFSSFSTLEELRSLLNSTESDLLLHGSAHPNPLSAGSSQPNLTGSDSLPAGSSGLNPLSADSSGLNSLPPGSSQPTPNPYKPPTPYEPPNPYRPYETSDPTSAAQSPGGIQYLLLGGGSNLLFTHNFDGLVLKNEIRGIELIREDEHYVYVRAGAGESWHGFVQYCLQRNWAGLENLSLIPGNVGAAPMQNIGAYGVEIKDVFYELEALDTAAGKVFAFSLNDCQFGYRDSVFKRHLRGRAIILHVTFRLHKIPKFHTEYGAIRAELDKMGVQKLSIQAISQAVIRIRSSKLPDPRQIGNAGSFFKNPTVTGDHFARLQAAFPGIPGYPAALPDPAQSPDSSDTGSLSGSSGPVNIAAPAGSSGTSGASTSSVSSGSRGEPAPPVKLAAGWLIEQCGWKGYRRGDAGCHALQALVLVNYGQASGKEIYDLSEEILQSVKNKFDVKLEREVNII